MIVLKEIWNTVNIAQKTKAPQKLKKKKKKEEEEEEKEKEREIAKWHTGDTKGNGDSLLVMVLDAHTTATFHTQF